MTAAQFKAYFLAEYDAATSLSAPGWEDSEITSFLNIAQDSIVTELYKNKDFPKLAEITQTTTQVPQAAFIVKLAAGVDILVGVNNVPAVLAPEAEAIAVVLALIWSTA